MVDFRLWGPVSALVAGSPLDLGPGRQRCALAALLVEPGRLVPVDVLIGRIWGENPPDAARNVLAGYFSRLRRIFDAAGATALLPRAAGGYLVRIDPAAVDAHRATQLRRRAESAVQGGDIDGAAYLLATAVQICQGVPLAGLTGDWVDRVRRRFSDDRLAVQLDLADVHLRVRRYLPVVESMRDLLGEDPVHEPAVRRLMIALHLSGQTAEGLTVFREFRRRLADEHGIDPGRDLQDLEQQLLRDELPADEAVAPPPRLEPPSGTIAPAELPPDIAAFTGRDDYLATLDSAVLNAGASGTTGIIAVVGMAGIGKTALAVHWGHRVRDRFPDGQLYVNLRGFAPGQAMRPIDALAHALTSLGVPPEQVPVHEDQASARFRSMVADRRVLLLLDNAADADQVRPLLPGGPRCVVVITSRNSLAGLVASHSATVLSLDVLRHAEAVTLLRDVVGDGRVRAEPESSGELVRLCAYLPLAVRISAANLVAHQRLTITEQVRGLAASGRIGALQVDGDRETAVRNAFDLSYAKLSPAAARLFRLLGLAPGSDISLAGTAALAGAAPVTSTAPVTGSIVTAGSAATARLLDELTSSHLVEETAPGRYGVHDLLRHYAAERSAEEDSAAERESAIQRLLDFYVANADSAAGQLYPQILRLPRPRRASTIEQEFDAAAASTWLDTERANLVDAVMYAADSGLSRPAVLLSDALRGYFYLRMHVIDWFTTARTALTAAQMSGDQLAEAATELSLATAYAAHGNTEPAILHFGHALRAAREAGWTDCEATALVNLGAVYRQSGHLKQAADNYVAALRLHRDTGRTAGEALTLANLAAVQYEWGNLAQSAEYNGQALALFQELGSLGGQAAAHNDLGEVWHLRGRTDLAMEHLDRALTLQREVGNRANEAETLRCIASVHRDEGRYAQAAHHAEQAMSLARETGEWRYEAMAANTAGTIQHRMGNRDKAARLFHRALALSRETGHDFASAEALIGLAGIGRAEDRREEADGQVREALELARSAGLRLLEGTALTCLAGLLLDGGEADRAAVEAAQALTIARDCDHAYGIQAASTVLARALAAGGPA